MEQSLTHKIYKQQQQGKEKVKKAPKIKMGI